MSLTVITGCMFSGKTTYLIKVINELIYKNKDIYIINSYLDTRTTTYIETHDNIKFYANKREHLNFTDNELAILQKSYDTIIIDEGQFFSNLKYNILRLLHYRFNIYVAGLDADSSQQQFGEILDLILIADYTIKLTGMCNICNNIGPFTKRINNNNNNNNQILVGAEDNYICVCRNHI
jgi:thymidine kinase